MQPIKDDRSFLKLLLLSIITLGIYEFWHLHHWTKDINTLCKDDGKNNEGVLLYILFTLVTCGLFPIFWWFKAADRLARAAVRESVAVDISGGKVLGAVRFPFGSPDSRRSCFRRRPPRPR